MKKKVVLGLLIAFLLSSAGIAQKSDQFYAGIAAGMAMPGNLQGKWINTARSQSADLTHLMSNGYSASFRLTI